MRSVLIIATAIAGAAATSTSNKCDARADRYHYDT